MTLETIDTHAGIAMAFSAELPRRIDGNGASLAINGDVTFNTFLETVTLAPYPLVHGLIALVEQEDHVIASYYRRRFHTLFSLSLWDYR